MTKLRSLDIGAVTYRDRTCTIAVSPAYGQFGIIRLKPFSEVHAEIAAYDESRPESFTPLTEVR